MGCVEKKNRQSSFNPELRTVNPEPFLKVVSKLGFNDVIKLLADGNSKIDELGTERLPGGSTKSEFDP